MLDICLILTIDNGTSPSYSMEVSCSISLCVFMCVRAIAAQIKEEIDRLATTFPNTVPELLEIHRSQDELENMVQGHDLVIR